MKQITIVGLALLFILTACSSNSGKQTPELTSETKVELPKTFYKKMKGFIGGIPVTMDLTKIDSALSGSYYYDKSGIPLSISGWMTTSDRFDITEMNEKYEETGKFSGTFTSEQIMEGTWTNTKTKKTLTFKLNETTDGIVSVTYEDYHKENCSNANKKQNVNEETLMWDSMCTTLDISLIKITAPNPTSSTQINQSIVSIVCEQSEPKYNSISDLLNSVNNISDDEGYSLQIECNLVTNDNNILCIRVGHSYYGFGAAHPFSSGNYHNFDIKTGKQITLDNILLPGFKNKLDRSGEKNFIEIYGSEGWDFEPGKFELNNNFAITPGGLLFSFAEYEIGPYAAGVPEVFIAYKEISDLINPSGLIGQWRKK